MRRPPSRHWSDFLNPLEWFGWIYGKWFVGLPPFIGYGVVCGGAGLLAAVLAGLFWSKAIDDWHEKHPADSGSASAAPPAASSTSPRQTRLVVDYEAITDTSRQMPEVLRSLGVQRESGSIGLATLMVARESGGHAQFQTKSLQPLPRRYWCTVRNDSDVALKGVAIPYQVWFSHSDPLTDPKPIVRNYVADVGDIAPRSASSFVIYNAGPVAAVLLTPTAGRASTTESEPYELKLLRSQSPGIEQGDRLLLEPQPAQISVKTTSELADRRDENLRKGATAQQLRAATPQRALVGVSGHRVMRNVDKSTIEIRIGVDNFSEETIQAEVHAQIIVNGKPLATVQNMIPTRVDIPAKRGHDLILKLTRNPKDYDAVWNGTDVVESLVVVDYNESRYTFRGRIMPDTAKIMTVENITDRRPKK